MSGLQDFNTFPAIFPWDHSDHGVETVETTGGRICCIDQQIMHAFQFTRSTSVVAPESPLNVRL